MGFSTGLSNPDEYVLGRGVIYFANRNASGFPQAFRDLGNAPEFNLNVESEKLEHPSSREGLKTIDKTVVLQVSATFSFTIDEPNLDNLALYLSGGTSTLSQTGGAVSGVENVVISSDNASDPTKALGRWYDLYLRADMSSGVAYPGNSADVRAYNLNSAVSPVVQVSGGGSTLVEGTDYQMDYAMGRLFLYDTAANRTEFISGSSLQNIELDVDFTSLATSIEQVNGLTQSSITGALKFIQKNAAASSVQAEYHIHAATLAPDGDLALIGDEFTTMAFTGTAEAATAVDSTSPVVRIRTYDGAGVS